jgi:hypothetical protein
VRGDVSTGSYLLWVFVFAFQMLRPQFGSVVNVQLTPQTLEAFERYVRATEARIDRQRARPETFLYIDTIPDPKREEVRAALKRGDVVVEQLTTRDPSATEIDVPGGIIHHWVGDVFLPGLSLRQVLDFVEDYDHHQNVYPEVVRSRLISRDGNDFKIALRLRYTKIITVTLNTEHDVRYTELDPTHWYARSASTRIAEVKNAGSPEESEKPVGHDGGFLWRINSYWAFVEYDGGVDVECESVSLTRDIPTGLGWLLRPLVTSIPRESLEHTLVATRSGASARAGGAHVGVGLALPPTPGVWTFAGGARLG